MEGLGKIEIKKVESGAENRQEKIKTAEKSVILMFEEKLAQVLDTIGKNPYFRDLEGNF